MVTVLFLEVEFTPIATAFDIVPPLLKLAELPIETVLLVVVFVEPALEPIFTQNVPPLLLPASWPTWTLLSAAEVPALYPTATALSAFELLIAPLPIATVSLVVVRPAPALWPIIVKLVPVDILTPAP